MRYQFASGRQQLPFTASDVVLADGGSISTSVTLYLAILGANPAGVNLLSPIVGPVTVNPGKRLQVTIAADPRSSEPGWESGERWESYVVGASTTATPESFVQLARIDALDADGNPLNLPLTATFSEDQHLVLSGIIPSASALPINPKHGALRAVSDLSGNVFEYDRYSALTPNQSSILSAVEGAWLYKPGNFSVFVSNTTQGGGCDRPLELIPPNLLRAPRYALGGNNGASRSFWIVNDTAEPVSAGRGIGFSVQVNGVPQGSTFDGLLRAIFRGYDNTYTGECRTTYAFDNAEFEAVKLEKLVESAKTDVRLPDDLQPGEAYSFSIYPNFEPAELNNQVPIQGILSVSPFVYLQAGKYTAAGEALGDWIYPRNEQGVLVPRGGLGLRCLKRSGMVNSRTFGDIGPDDINGLSPNTANQLIAINGNGFVYRREGELIATEALRGIVSSKPGRSDSCDWSDPITASGAQGLQVTCVYPSNGSTATIRVNYPEQKIAGLSGRAQLNAVAVTIYVQAGDEIRRFSGNLLVDGTDQEFELNDWNDGETIDFVPSSPNAYFSLFQPVAASAVENGPGNFPAGSLRVRYAFEYDGNSVTAISMDSAQGCIHTARLTLAEMEKADQAWAETTAVSDVATIPRRSIDNWQTRRLTNGARIVYDPNSRLSHNGVSAWQPIWQEAEEAGRWRLDGSQLTFEDVLPFILALGG